MAILLLWAAAPAAHAADSADDAARTEPSATHEPAPDLLAAFERHCEVPPLGASCNIYFSKRETAQVQQQVDSGGTKAAIGVCGAFGGPGAAICAPVLTIHATRIERNVKAAVDREGCFVVRYNFVGAIAVAPGSPAAVTFGNVAGNHRFCKP